MKRREFLKLAGLSAAAAITGAGGRVFGDEVEVPVSPKPSPQQLLWHQAELGMFLHFGINTFTDREWGDGTEDPRVFNPTQLDGEVWARVARRAGFRYAILTAKHHDGFCLWPSKYTQHSVASSPWKYGRGDVVREFTDAFRKCGIKIGLYLSPWDRNCPFYGDSPRYNEYFKNQLTELLSNYGEIFEVWFDGACGEGPNGKKQEYDWRGYYDVIRRLQPNALIAISGPDIRWVGNENGVAQETQWCPQDPNPTFHPGKKGKVWWPAESDVSIRPGWFWHASEDDKVKTIEQLVDIYFSSVGRNTGLLLNVPPMSDGMIGKPDMKSLYGWTDYLAKMFATDYAKGKAVTADSVGRGSDAGYAVDGKDNTHWTPEVGVKTASLEVDLGAPVTFNVSMVQEQIGMGQYVEEYHIAALTEGGDWREIAKGTTIGHKKLDRFEPVKTSRVKLTITSPSACPHISAFGLFTAPKPA